MSTMISVFKSLFNLDTPFAMNLEEVIDMIKNPREELLSLVNRIRDEQDKEKIQELKKGLYAIMFNGTFSARYDNKLVEHSGLCVLDFDKYPTNELMMAHREELIEDPHTLLCFVSPSGRGLKVLIKIPKSNKDEHIRRFNAYKEYVDSEYFDEKNCNVSRVCYASVDTNLYYNPDSVLFESIQEEVINTYESSVAVVPVTSDDEVINRIMSWNFNKDFVEGERNDYLFMIASHFCEYGVNKFTAEGYLLSNFAGGGFTDREVKATVKSAYGKREFGIYFFEDFKKLDVIKAKLKEGISVDVISRQEEIDVDSVEEIKTQVKSDESSNVFWTIDVNNKGVEKIIIEPLDFVRWLESKGYKKYFPEDAIEPILVFVNENRVVATSEDKIRDFTKDSICKEFPDVYNHFMKSTGLLKPQTLNSLESINLLMLQDTVDTAFIPYRNGVVKVSVGVVELLKYIDVDGYIWEAQILNRDFIYNDDCENDFKDFISKVSNSTPERIQALESVLGYLTHTYKSKTNQKAIIFNDEEISDIADGGSGKSLVMVAVSHFRRLVKIDGKKFDFGSDFAYQRVELDTQVLSFDDVKKNFDFESLFSLITEGIAVNKKNRDEIFIPFERSPKIVITTNYVINGSGSSHNRRRHEIEFNQYFNENNTPESLYGRMMFDSDAWNIEDWIKFDNYMIKNIQLYLSKGLMKVESINSDVKRFIQSTSKDFYDFVSENNIPLNVRLDNKVIFDSFVDEFKTGFEITSRKFQIWIDLYARYTCSDVTKGKSNGSRYTILNNTKKKKNELPF